MLYSAGNRVNISFSLRMLNSKRYETLWKTSTSDPSDPSDSRVREALQTYEDKDEACKIDDTDELLSTSGTSRYGESGSIATDGDVLILSDDDMLDEDDVAEASQVISENDLNAMDNVESHSDIEESIEPIVYDSYIEDEAP
jgi:hypothetical protein